jgi:hypothetical protein
MKLNPLKISNALIAFAFLAAMAVPASANGLGEDKPWGFKDANTGAVQVGVAALMEQVKNGYYATPNYSSTYTTNCASGAMNCSSGLNAMGGNLTNTSAGAINSITNTGNGSVSSSATLTNTGSHTATQTVVGQPLP